MLSRLCTFSLCGRSLHKDPQSLIQTVLIPSLPPTPGLAPGMHIAGTRFRHIYCHNPAKGISDLGPSSSCSSRLTFEFRGEFGEDSLDMSLYITALMSASLGYKWLLAGLLLYSVTILAINKI
jgi:hypothetical protein